MDYPDEPIVITRVLMIGMQQGHSQRRRYNNGSKVRVIWGHEPMNMGSV